MARMLSRAQRSQTQTSPRRGSISTIQVSGGLSSTAPHVEQLTAGGTPAGFTPAGFIPAGFTPAGFTPAGYRGAPPWPRTPSGPDRLREKPVGARRLDAWLTDAVRGRSGSPTPGGQPRDAAFRAARARRT